MNDIPLKQCNTCKREFPATTEHFHRKHDNRDGLRTFCKECAANKVREWRLKNLERERRVGRERANASYAANPEKFRQRTRDYYHLHPDQRRTVARKYYRANAEEKREYSRQYRKANMEKVRKAKRRWDKTHPENKEKKRERGHRRRARIKNAPGSFTTKDLQAQYNRQKGCCYYCGERVGDTWHVDHIVPIARGGSNGPENIVIACPKCNMHKHDKMPHEWPEGGRLL